MSRDLFTSGRWLLNRGALRNPCDGAGCKRWIGKGEYYWRETGGDHFCVQCTPEPLYCLVEPCTWATDDCPFQSCPHRGVGAAPLR
jgi:hypothetical protein